MLNIIKMEFLKLKRRSKFKGILITLWLSSMILFPFMYADKMNHSWNEAITLSFEIISLITNVFLCILSGELFVDEYKSKTINIIFTYPISRTKIYISKLSVMSLYSCFITIFGSIIFNIVAYCANRVHPTLTDNFNINILLKILFLVIFYSIFNSIVSIIYVFFSTVKISISLMVVACILILNVTSNNDITKLWPYGLIPIFITLISTVLAFITINHLNNKDVFS